MSKKISWGRPAGRWTIAPYNLHGTLEGYHKWGCRCKPCKNAVVSKEQGQGSDQGQEED